MGSGAEELAMSLRSVLISGWLHSRQIIARNDLLNPEGERQNIMYIGSKEKRDTISRRAVLKGGALVATAVAFDRLGWASADEPPSIPQVRLANGVMMPMLGFGTYGLRGDVCAESVADAITVGYRLIDTAKVYQNEEAVGAGIKKSGIDRKLLFVTSKIWVDDAGYQPAKRAFQTTLDKLQLEYLDLYLIHRPRGDVQGSWRAMEELNAAGKIRAIGVSNFDQAQLASLTAGAKTKPVINQVETHPFFQETAEFRSLRPAGVQMEAWAPLAEGRNGLFTNSVLEQIGTKHGRTVAQIVLRWHYQRGIVAIPRSSNPEHRRENLKIFDFSLDSEDIRKITALDENRSLFPEWT
jgi:2,5-diketo-D-gluconate reductase A